MFECSTLIYFSEILFVFIINMSQVKIFQMVYDNTNEKIGALNIFELFFNAIKLQMHITDNLRRNYV